MVLVGDDGKPVEGVRLSSADVNVQIRGPLAEATMRLTFKNETGRIAGGELTFPLPEGATVAGYGLDINGVMVEGVAVEKQQARVIYEKEIRKNVDPGLVEHVAGNNFRTRLFPVPPNGSRTIQITYIADLVSARRGAGASFTMPLGFGKIDGLKIAAFVGAGGGGAPVMHGGSYEKAFEAAAGGYQLIDSPKTEKPLDELTILLPESPGSSLTVQKRLKTAVSVEDLEEIARGGPAAKRFGNYEHYFVLTDTPAKPAAIPAALKNQRVLIVWDASLSRAGSDTAHELKLLEASLTQLGHPSFDIALLRNTLEVQPPFGPGPAELARGLALLKSVTYDGATNIGLLTAPKNRANFHFVEAGQRQLDYDLAIAFTDGLGTVGPNMPGKMEIPVYTLTGDASANHALLRQLSHSTGGNYLNLKRESDAAVLSAIGQSPFALIGVEYNPKEIADVSPGVGTHVSERVTVSGKLLAAQASVTLVYGYGKQETSRRTLPG